MSLAAPLPAARVTGDTPPGGVAGDVNMLTEAIREVASTDWYVAALSTAYGPTPAAGANITARIIAAAEDALAQGKPLFIGAGDWVVDPDALSFTGVHVMGAGRDHAILRSSSGTRAGAGITLGIGASMVGLYVRGFAEGILNTGHWTRVYECRASYNTVGIRYADGSYICEAYVNDLTFNDLGVLTGNESYQLVIRDNIIDNNNGVGVAICSTSSGVILVNNTIEGNRNYTSGFGCGVLVWGTYATLDIVANWFEANGDTADSVDILFQTGAAGEMLPVNQAVVDTLIPAAYRAGFYSSGTTLKKMGVIQANLDRNRHRFTRYGTVVGGWTGSVVNIRGNSYKGVIDRFNKHIYLNTEAVPIAGIQVNIDGNGYKNTDNAAIDAQVLTGVGGSIVHTAYTPGLSAAADITLDGRNLFTGDAVTLPNAAYLQGRRADGVPTPILTVNPSDQVSLTHGLATAANRPEVRMEPDGMLRILQGGTSVLTMTGKQIYIANLAVTANGRRIHAFSTNPEGAVTANPGDLGVAWNGGRGTSLWVKETGTGNTGWAPAGGSSGSTAVRPTPLVGLPFFDTTLGKPIWGNGTAWVDATGTAV